MGAEKMPRFSCNEAIDRLWDRSSIILKNDEKREEFPLDQISGTVR